MNIKLESIIAREILDSRGNPTIEVEVSAQGQMARAIAPSGASCGKNEACELRDNDKQRYGGKGVLKAVANVNNIIAHNLKEIDISDQKLLDAKLIELDDTDNKSNLGANAILATSLACAKLTAQILNLPLYQYINQLLRDNHATDVQPAMPTPFINIINGGMHADNLLSIQEFMIVPLGEISFKEKIRKSSEVFHKLKELLKSEEYTTNVGDEGGFAPELSSNNEALDCITHAIEESGYKLGVDFSLALDVAASSMIEEEKNNKTIYRIYPKAYEDAMDELLDGLSENSPEYKMAMETFSNVERDTNGMVDYLEDMADEYSIISIEDGLGEEDYEGWKQLTAKLGDQIQLIGDDLFVTNPKILAQGIKEKIANSILIKPNQIGTLTETLDTIALAYKNNYKYMISHRSGETEDTFIAHLAVGTASHQIKTGSVCRGERTAKYNELIRIEEYLI